MMAGARRAGRRRRAPAGAGARHPAPAGTLERVRGILSDLDGTLVDSTPAVMRVWRRWRADRGLPQPATHPHGIPARAVVVEEAPHLDADAEAAELERREIADTDGVRPLPGAAELLAGASGVPVAIVTSCTVPLARVRIAAAGLAEPGVMVTSERTDRVKPHPAPYLLGARELGLPPAACLVLEDAPAGVRAGLDAGCRVAALRSGGSGDAELAGAHEVHDDVAAFLAALRG